MFTLRKTNFTETVILQLFDLQKPGVIMIM